MRIVVSRLIRFIFYGNYFYGACAVALAVEAGLQQQVPLPGWSFFLLLFTSTIWYYTYSYQHSSPDDTSSKRVVWYFKNKKIVDLLQLAHLGLAFISAVLYFELNHFAFANINLLSAIVLAIFPLIGAFYYGAGVSESKKFTLRQLGRLKPFVIGFVWAGPVTIYPMLFSNIENHVEFQITLVGALLFLKNFMFIAMLGIMFDIKDYASDYKQSLGTFVTRAGLRKTIFTILLPLSLLGLGTFVFYGITRQFSAMKIMLNTLPFLLLILVAWSLVKRRSILYYLVVVDGLMIAKAVCGTAAMTFF